MVNLVVGSSPFNMATWDLSDLANGAMTLDSATEVDITGAGGHILYRIFGTGFTSFNGRGFPTSGTVTGFSQEAVGGTTPMQITGMSLSATTFTNDLTTGDYSGLESTIFQSDDTFTGRGHDDTLIGFSGNDTFNLSRGGNDTVQGGDGNDVFHFGSAFTAADTIDGGTGSDKLVLNGDYSAGVTMANSTMTNVEAIAVGAGFNYKLALSGSSVLNGQTLTVDARALDASHTLNFNFAAIHGAVRVFAGAGDDTITGGTLHLGNGLNVFDLSAGGNDTVLGSGGKDKFNFGAAFTAADHVDGGTTASSPGADTLNLVGDYSAPLVLGSSIDHIVRLNITSPSVDLTLGSDNSEAGFFFVNIHAANVTVDLSAESGTTPVTDLYEAATGTITGSVGGDRVIVRANSPDITVNGNGGDDLLQIDGSDHVTASGVHIDGGTGNNELIVEHGVVTLTPDNLVNIQTLLVFNHTIVTDDDVAAGHTLKVLVESGKFDGSAETDGTFNMTVAGTAVGGAGADTFANLSIGSAPSGKVTGGLGGDTLDDIHKSIYHDVAESTGVNYDTIEHFDLTGASNQVFRGIDKPAAFDAAIANAAISTATFDADLAAAVGTAQMAAGDAVVVHVTSGTLSGQVFLVVDHNGVAGYQADADWVLDLSTGTNPAHISTGIFT